VPVILSDIFGDPNVGIFSFANENIAVLPAGISTKKLDSYREALGIEACSIGVADSRLVGVYTSGNSNAILLPYIATPEEISKIRSTGTKIAILQEKRTALGNLILCNDYGAVIDPRLKPKTVSAIEKALKVRTDGNHRWPSTSRIPCHRIQQGSLGKPPHRGVGKATYRRGFACPSVSRNRQLRGPLSQVGHRCKLEGSSCRVPYSWL